MFWKRIVIEIYLVDDKIHDELIQSSSGFEKDGQFYFFAMMAVTGTTFCKSCHLCYNNHACFMIDVLLHVYFNLSTWKLSLAR